MCVCVKCCPALIFMISFMGSVSLLVAVAVSAQFQFYVSPLIIHTAPKAAATVIVVVVVMQAV